MTSSKIKTFNSSRYRLVHHCYGFSQKPLLWPFEREWPLKAFEVFNLRYKLFVPHDKQEHNELYSCYNEIIERISVGNDNLLLLATQLL